MTGGRVIEPATGMTTATGVIEVTTVARRSGTMTTGTTTGGGPLKWVGEGHGLSHPAGHIESHPNPLRRIEQRREDRDTLPSTHHVLEYSAVLHRVLAYVSTLNGVTWPRTLHRDEYASEASSHSKAALPLALSPRALPVYGPFEGAFCRHFVPFVGVILGSFSGVFLPFFGHFWAHFWPFWDPGFRPKKSEIPFFGPSICAKCEYPPRVQFLWRLHRI